MINPEDHISKKEVQRLLGTALPGQKILNIIPIIRGSTNIIFHVKTFNNNYILKISHRDDRNKGKVLEKEAKILSEHQQQKNYTIPVPKLLWQGQTEKGWPAILISFLEGERIEDLIKPGINVKNAAKNLGRFLAQWHKNKHPEINEFETGRSSFPDFNTYARHWLKELEPLCLKATHIKQKDIRIAYNFIYEHLHLFKEKRWPFIQGDITNQNLLGKIKNGKLILTGLCDFENVQTGPMEYDIATIHDGIFLFYPEMEKPFLEGYREISPTSKNFKKRLKAVNLFRALRYIKRSVKYNEIHYFNHDRKYFKSWLKKSKLDGGHGEI